MYAIYLDLRNGTRKINTIQNEITKLDRSFEYVWYVWGWTWSCMEKRNILSLLVTGARVFLVEKQEYSSENNDVVSYEIYLPASFICFGMLNNEFINSEFRLFVWIEVPLMWYGCLMNAQILCIGWRDIIKKKLLIELGNCGKIKRNW